MASITVDRLEAEVKKILKEYGDDTSRNLTQITNQVTKKGVQALKAESAATFGESKQRKKKYKNTWTSTMVTKRLSSQGTIYNTQAGLPHLLEKGHALVAGGRKIGEVPGRVHIAKVEDELIRLFEKEVKSKL